MEPTSTAPKMTSRLPSVQVSVFLLVLAVLLVAALHVFQGYWQHRARAGAVQAVFLTNGQVYFGNLRASTGDEVILDNVYYLQSATSPQPASGQSQSAANTNVSVDTNSSQPSYTLVKLGQELHGPTSRMYINRSQVLFTEDLRADSQVSQAIRAAQ